MIDYFNIAVDSDNPLSIGKPVTVQQSANHKTQSFTPVKISAGTYAPQFELQYDYRQKQLFFRGSPALLLQGQNAYGSNDLQWLVRETIPLVCRTIQLELPDDVMQRINSGRYSTSEVHVTEHFRLPAEIGTVASLCDWIRRFAPTSYSATPLVKGIGVRLFPGSRSRQILLYDKQHYYTDKPIRHKLSVMGNLPLQTFERIGTGILFDKMCAELSNTLRLECRFKRKLGAKAWQLTTGTDWSVAKAKQLYRDTVAELQFGLVPASSALEAFVADASEPKTERVAVALWLAYRNVRHLSGSAASFYRMRKQLLDKLGIDLSIPYVPSQPIDWSTLTDWSNRVGIPEWAIENYFVHVPETASQGVAASYQRAWLDQQQA